MKYAVAFTINHNDRPLPNFKELHALHFCVIQKYISLIVTMEPVKYPMIVIYDST